MQGRTTDTRLYRQQNEIRLCLPQWAMKFGRIFLEGPNKPVIVWHIFDAAFSSSDVMPLSYPMRSVPDTMSSSHDGWRGVSPLLLGAFLARVLYLVFLCPYELAADEAHYWEWARRLDWSYYSKGPGVAWAIALSTRLFGHAEWAIRLPAAVSGLIAAWCLARLSAEAWGRHPRSAWYAAIFFLLAPGWHATSQFMTIDAPFYACWAASLLLAWRIHTTASQTARRVIARWAVLGVVLGIGFLFKYTMLLLVPGLAAFFWRSRTPRPGKLISTVGPLVCLFTLAVCAAPVFVWNAHHDWPTLAHLLGHANLPGGDITARSPWSYNPFWTISCLAGPFVFVGPPGALLIISALRRIRRDRTADAAERDAIRFCYFAAAPILLFYLLLSFSSDIEVNWPAAGYLSLAVLAAWRLSHGLPRFRELRLRGTWRWFVAVGIVAALLVSFGGPLLHWLRRSTSFGAYVPIEIITRRVEGHRKLAQRVEQAMVELEHKTGLQPFLVADNYTRASLMGYYVTGHPSVRSASYWRGGRKSSFDFFPDTSLTDPALNGRPAVLIGANEDSWKNAFFFDRVWRLSRQHNLYAGTNYAGPRPAAGAPVKMNHRPSHPITAADHEAESLKGN